MLDLVLEGGKILDGTGAPVFIADIAIADGHIARIGDCADFQAKVRFDSRGLVVAPGFIDMHGHSDEILLVNPLAQSKIRQGITTEVGGNCGSSPGPFSFQARALYHARLIARYGFEPAWQDMDGFFTALEHAGLALNFCCLVGLGNTREAVGGTGPEPLSAEALASECALVAEACVQGAVGVSSGLIYPPSRFADTEELIALARAAARAGSPLYASHLRSEADELIEAVNEALDVGRRADVALQISHHKAAGKKNWGKVQDTLARIDHARDRGLDVLVDQYPYTASSTGLDTLLPADVNVGPPGEVVDRLADPRYAALVALRLELDNRDRWNDIVVATVFSQENKRYEGMTIFQIARQTGRTPAAAAVQLLLDEHLDVDAIFFTMCEDDVRTVLSYRQTCIGSDSSARSTSGPTSAGKPHPRAYGTFPRIFSRYVRQQNLLSLEEAVRRATSLPAQRLGLRERGKVATGWHADLVVFDAEKIEDLARYEDPHRYPAGITHVIVNGVPVVENEAVTGALPGSVLRRGRDL